MNSNIVRAWKDEFYRQSLSDEERAQLPENPVGELELTDTELEGVFGGHGHHNIDSHVLCPHVSFVDGCFTHFVTRECIYPHYTQDFDDCYYSYRFSPCQHYTFRDFRACYPPQFQR